MRGALHIHKIIVDEVRGSLREAGDGAVASGFSGLRDFGKLWEIGYVGAGSEPVEMFFVEVGADGVEFAEGHAARFWKGSFVDQDDGFGLDAQAAVMRKNAGDMNPVAIAVFVRRAARGGSGDEPERDTALAIVVNGAETDFVVAFVDGSVVNEFRGVEKMESIHATAA